MNNITVWQRYQIQLQKAIKEKQENKDKILIGGEYKKPDQLIYETKIDMKLNSLINKINFDEFNEIRDLEYWCMRDKLKNEYSRKEYTIQIIEEYLKQKNK